MTLSDVIVLDIDSPRSLRDLYRIRKALPRPAAVSTTRRGLHIWMTTAGCEGWEQRDLNLAVRNWLGAWHPVDPAKVGHPRGFLLDFRTGHRRYVVWPGQEPARRWLTLPEYKDRVVRAGRWMPPWREGGAGAAPWNLSAADRQALQDEIRDTAVARREERTSLDPETAWQDLERWCKVLAGKSAESGRNNLLNQIAYYSGAGAVHAGFPVDTVVELMMDAAEKCKCPGAMATIRSGLRGGGVL